MAFTFFFRDEQILELSIKHLLPYISGRSKVRIWNAGCAMGMETYSLVILLSEAMGKFAFKSLHISATDIDESNQFEQIIKTGTYKYTDLKRIPKELFNKYFTTTDKDDYFKLDYNIINRVEYKKHDLLTLNSIGNEFSLILCKNVLLHFSQAQRIDVLKIFHQSLAVGGYIAMEQTQKMPDELSHLFTRVANNGQLYKKN